MKLIAALLVLILPLAQQKGTALYVCKNLSTTLYSEAPVENIEAASVKGFSVINLKNGDVQFNIPIRSFQFKKSLMQEHFNENYMESDKYPYAKFKGHFNEAIDPSKFGEYSVNVSGEFEVHGVKQHRTFAGMIKVKQDVISISSKFTVLCKDHNITIPKLVFKNVAESILITVDGIFAPYAANP